MFRIARLLALSIIAYFGGLLAVNLCLLPTDMPLAAVDAYAWIGAYAAFLASYVVLRPAAPPHTLLPLLAPRPVSVAVRSLAMAALAYLALLTATSLAGVAPRVDPAYDGGTPTAIAFIVLAAAAEEVFYRGYLHAMVCKVGGNALAVVLVATAYTLMHGTAAFENGIQFAAFFTFGAALSMLALRYRTLLPGVVVHAGFNYATGLAPLQLPEPLDYSGVFYFAGYQPADTYLACQVVLALLVIGALLPAVSRRARPVVEDTRAVDGATP